MSLLGGIDGDGVPILAGGAPAAPSLPSAHEVPNGNGPPSIGALMRS